MVDQTWEPSEWNMQRVMATLGYASKEVGQTPDEANAVYYTFCPWEEFARTPKTGHGPKALKAIAERWLKPTNPQAPEALKRHCQDQADAAVNKFKAQQAAAHKIMLAGQKAKKTPST